MGNTKIEWAEKVWNPIVGCTKCSPGCLNCYAERLANRFDRTHGTDGKLRPYYCQQGYNYDWKGLVACRPDVLDQPLHWRKPCRIFVCSMSDLFHPKVPFEFIDKVFAVATLCPQHTFLILTKRINRTLEYVLQEPRGQIDHAITNGLTHFVGRGKKYTGKGLTKHLRNKNQLWPLPNVHLVVSISNQPEADEKIPILLQIPATVRGLSIEPMLGPIDLHRFVFDYQDEVRKSMRLGPPGITELEAKEYVSSCLDWVVVGGESGPKAREMHPDWVRGIRDQCVAAGVKFYFKQWGKWGIAEPIPNDRQKRFRIVGGSEPLSPNTIFKIFPEHEISTIPMTGWVKVGKKKASCLLDGRKWKQLPGKALK